MQPYGGTEIQFDYLKKFVEYSLLDAVHVLQEMFSK